MDKIFTFDEKYLRHCSISSSPRYGMNTIHIIYCHVTTKLT